MKREKEGAIKVSGNFGETFEKVLYKNANVYTIVVSKKVNSYFLIIFRKKKLIFSN